MVLLHFHVLQSSESEGSAQLSHRGSHSGSLLPSSRQPSRRHCLGDTADGDRVWVSDRLPHLVIPNLLVLLSRQRFSRPPVVVQGQSYFGCAIYGPLRELLYRWASGVAVPGFVDRVQ